MGIPCAISDHSYGCSPGELLRGYERRGMEYCGRCLIEAAFIARAGVLHPFGPQGNFLLWSCEQAGLLACPTLRQCAVPSARLKILAITHIAPLTPRLQARGEPT